MDQVDDAELVDLVELEVRELLDFNGDPLPSFSSKTTLCLPVPRNKVLLMLILMVMM